MVWFVFGGVFGLSVLGFVFWFSCCVDVFLLGFFLLICCCWFVWFFFLGSNVGVGWVDILFRWSLSRDFLCSIFVFFWLTLYWFSLLSFVLVVLGLQSFWVFRFVDFFVLYFGM